MNRSIVLLALLTSSFVGGAEAQEAASKPASEARKERVLSYLETASNTSASAAGSPEQRLRDMYASYMDTARIDALGLKPLHEDLQRIAKARSKEEIAALYGQGNFIYVPFSTGIQHDPGSSGRHVAAISQSGLDMQTRAPYVDMNPKSVEVREKFVVLVANLLALVDGTDSHTRAEQILKLETAIAKGSRPEELERDEASAKKTWTLAELSQQAPGFAWGAYLKSNGIPERTPLLVAQPDVVRNVARIIDETELRVLKDHLTFSLICTWGWAGVLPQSVYDTQFEFYGRVRRGATEQPDRRTRAFSFLRRTLPEDLKALDVALEDASKRTLRESSPSLESPQIQRADIYGNAKRAHVWNWQQKLAFVR